MTDSWCIGDPEPAPAECAACEACGTFPLCCPEHGAEMCPNCFQFNHPAEVRTA